jgi:hypothetical protein
MSVEVRLVSMTKITLKEFLALNEDEQTKGGSKRVIGAHGPKLGRIGSKLGTNAARAANKAGTKATHSSPPNNSGGSRQASNAYNSASDSWSVLGDVSASAIPVSGGAADEE